MFMQSLIAVLAENQPLLQPHQDFLMAHRSQLFITQHVQDLLAQFQPLKQLA
jgi:hypothetical protein